MMKWIQKSKTILSVLVALSIGLAFGCANSESSGADATTVAPTTSVTTTESESSSETTKQKESSSEETTTQEETTTTESTTESTSESKTESTTEETTTESSEETTTTEETTTEETTTSETTEGSSSKEETQTSSETSEPSSPSDPSDPEKKGLVVHFIDVDQGDSSLIICDGEAMLIDGGSSDKSELIYAYLKKYEITHLKYIVATHPDDDYIGGLSAALIFATVERAFCSVDEYDSKPFSSFQKYLNKQKVELEIPEAGTELALGCAKLTVLAPIKELESTNNNSIVIRLEYGKTSFLFTGDAEFDEEDTILFSDRIVESTVLKVGHHGSEYSTSKDFLDAISPSIAIISCGKDNTYGFPKQTVLDLLKERNVDLYRTDMHGDILVYSNGEKITVSMEKEPDGDVFLAPVIESPDPGSEVDCDYICNKNSHKFHYPNCEAVRKMKEANKLYFKGDRQELIDDGYVPCKICNP